MENNFKSLYSEEEIIKRVNEIAAKINVDYKDKQKDGIVILSVLKGSFVFTADLIRKLNIKFDLDFISISSYGNGLESSGSLKIYKDISCDIKAKHVLIVEDLIDTGVTLNKIVSLVKSRDVASVEICALLDKNKSNIKATYLGFDCIDEFIFGYGIDMKHQYRNLPGIFCLK